MSVTIGGTFSGLNVSSIISAIIAADSIPITNLQTTNTTLTTQSTDLGDLGTSLGELSSTLQSLGSNSLFSQQTATVGTPTVGSATVSGTAKAGTLSINIQQLSTNSILSSGTGVGSKVTTPPAGSTLIGNVLNETAVDGQTFTVNGKIITLAATDTLDGVIGKINSSGAGVTASYSNTTGAVSITSGSPVILGSGADTSDFLQQAELFNNGTGTVTSTTGLGRINETADLTTAGLAATPTTGTFTINGVPITYNAGDSLDALIGSINSSSAGVTAVYDTYQDQIVLSSTSRGAENITVADGTSNVGSALGLTAGNSTLQLGKSTLFTVNGSATVRQSNSNVIDSGTLGVPGVTFTATDTGTTQVTVGADVTSIATAINAFITQYNKTQTTIASFTSVNASDPTQNGPLATDTNLTFLAPQLRQMTSGSISNSATIRMLSDLGVTTNATDNTLTQVDSSKLQDALTNHLSDVEALFNDPTSGLTTTVQSVLSSYNDSLNGVIVNEQNNIAKQISFNKAQISQMQERISAEQTRLQAEFAALDAIESKNSGLSSIFNSASGTSSGATATSSSGSSSFGSVGGT